MTTETYCKGQLSDQADILDFGNYVFSQSESGRPHNFKTLLPKIYNERYNTTEWHYLCKVDDRIKAMVMLEKSSLRVGKHTLIVGGIGTVAVHPYSRGSGYMKKLMTSAVEDIRSDCDLGVLGGQRQRYEYFGFEPSGITLSFTVTASNIRHCYKGIKTDDIEFVKVSPTDEDYINFIRKLQRDNPLSGTREGSNEHFFDVMSSWNAELWVITVAGGQVGYISGFKDEINEIMLTDYTILPNAIAAYIHKLSTGKCRFSTSLVNRELIRELSLICEHHSISNNHNFLLANPKKVIEAFLELKATYASLQDGSVILKIADKTLQISLNNGVVDVSETNNTPLLALSELDALRLLFSTANEFDEALTALPTYAREWFPLPLFFPSADGS